MVPESLFVLIPLGGMATGALFMVGIYKLLSRWMELRHRRDLPPALDDELQELRGQVAELSDLPHRVAELEERLDFAERLLAQARSDRVELGPGGT
jgi:Tfp pilus assembly protein PilN